VLDMLHEIGRNVGRPVSYELAAPRAGDAARVVAATERAAAVLGWRAATALDEAVRHAVRDARIVADRPPG
jgi:UDP-glucose 4-epimerase